MASLNTLKNRIKKKRPTMFHVSRTIDGSVVTYKRKKPKVARNDKCPCGSGNKFKKCCLNKVGY